MMYTISLTAWDHVTTYQWFYLGSFLIPIGLAIVQLRMLRRQGYMIKKGQNAADREDIKGLTKAVEEIKNEFIRENANLAMALDMLKDRRSKNYNQAQIALIDYYKSINEWVQKIMALSPQNLTANELDIALNWLNDRHPEYVRHGNMLALLLDDEKLISACYDLTGSLLVMNSQVSQFMPDIINHAKHMESLQRHPAADTERVDKILMKIFDRVTDLSVEMYEKRNQNHKAFSFINTKFLDLAKAYLRGEDNRKTSPQ